MASHSKLFTEAGPFGPTLKNFSQQAAFTVLPISPRLKKPVTIDESTDLPDNRLVVPLSNSLGWIAFIGKGAEDATFSARAVAWRKQMQADIAGGPTPELWVPKILLQVDVILSAMVGIDDHKLIKSDVRFADTIAITRSVGNTTLDSPADDSLATVLFDQFGHELIEWEIALGTATDANVIHASF